mmetsp:Transcript_19463/g.42309  ORF Transcript_19463/g.42309 Transcript_19463/m.42309 type:complete len:1662 (-) Transcript_19463:341-5326(-)
MMISSPSPPPSSSATDSAPPDPKSSSKYSHHTTFFVSYLLFGLLHEFSHLAIASVFLSSSQSSLSSLCDLAQFVARALLGRYCLIEIDNDDNVGSSFVRAHLAIRHFGWIFSLAVAVGLHYCQHVRSLRSGTAAAKKSSFWRLAVVEPIVIVAAYVTALEAITTDLLGFVPIFHQHTSNPMPMKSESSTLLFFCGNFGILLINSSWINVDGGKKALDMLEKMVEVTMMRGAQSGGVVTFEPAKSGHSENQAPIIRGIRSRVVNAKRTVLSKGVRSKIEKDVCSMLGNNLRGWNDKAFNPNSTGKRLVRGFFGHTRFATSSKASMDGTHPHQWSPRRFYTFFPFQSAAASKGSTAKRGSHAVGTGLSESGRSTSQNKKIMHLEPKSQSIGVENFVTHNGDFEFYKINGKYYDTEAIQQWLTKALRVSMPATVDSAAIAGMMDLLRVQGCFALSARYAVCFKMGGCSKDVNPMDPSIEYPTVWHYEEIGKVFEKALDEMVHKEEVKSLEEFNSSDKLRDELVSKISGALIELVEIGSSKNLGHGMMSAFNALVNFVSLDFEEGDLGQFVRATVNAFFDNDLMQTTKIFLKNAKGSFGLCVTTSMDAHRQVVFAAKGQTLSVAFYPRKGLVLYASEQAAVKAGLNYEIPHGKSMFGTDFKCVDENSVRLDLDDLSGEIVLLDWGYGGDSEPAVSLPNRGLAVDKLMGGTVNVILLHLENAMNKSSKLHKRLVQLENNEFIKPLLDDCDDPVLADIKDIPRICSNIQEDWQDIGLNRMTAWHLGQCIRQRIQGRVDGTIESHTNQVDILVTGCEVSLWAAEQFVADLQKCFPKLGVKAVSSNKLLGLFGQELAMPSIGFPFSQQTLEMKDPIVIIVSHSGGTFGPLACSNLMQSFSSSIFTVTSEWDTQCGKQLRGMFGDKNDLLTSRIFSTEVGVRPAEPCSVSVVATHQLLTNIFEHICVTIISNPHFRSITGSIITEWDLQTLERCNRDNIKSLERIVGVDREGNEIHDLTKHKELRAAGDIWAEHILENAKAYIMSFVYIIVTVTLGFPLISGIAYAAGLRDDKSPGDWLFYLARFFDALIYFWLPQINVFILRLLQGRNLRHRMVGRTVVIGDPCPWVAQSAEAFLSKIFACSYSIAGLNVLSGNPADHLVHRHTHRVVRGSLFVCGRPDGRLTALTTLEASTCLAVNQASSIQSIGGTCESITIGHNMSKLPLSFQGIFLETHRPNFLCEQLLDEADEADIQMANNKTMNLTATGNLKADHTSFVSQRFMSTEGGDEPKFQSSMRQDSRNAKDDLDDSFVSTENEAPHSQESQRKTPRGNGWTKLRGSINRGSSNMEDDLISSFVGTENEPPQSQESNHEIARRRTQSRLRGSILRKSSNGESDSSGANKCRSSACLLGIYSNMEKDAKEKSNKQGIHDVHHLDTVINDMIKERRGNDRAIAIFHDMDKNHNGAIDFREFTVAYKKINPEVSMVQLEAMFEEADIDGNGTLDLDEFIKMTKLPQVDVLGKLSVANRDARGLVQVMPSTEKYFGEELKNSAPKGVGVFTMAQSQRLSMELYESRMASMQRFVAMTVMFHQMGMRVESFFPKISFGLLGYRMDRTHSIMRIATTASPVSGADVREQMEELRLMLKIERSVQLIARTWKKWKLETKNGTAVQ